MCPYTHLQGLQEVQVRDSLRPNDWPTGGCSRRVARGSGHRDQVVVVAGTHEEVREPARCASQGSPHRPNDDRLEATVDAAAPAEQVRLHRLIMERHEKSRVSASATANSDAGRGRDECLRVNTAPDESLGGDKGRQSQDSAGQPRGKSRSVRQCDARRQESATLQTMQTEIEILVCNGARRRRMKAQEGQ